MPDLIPIHQDTIGRETIPTVNARDLHTFLEPQARFNDWITRRIKSYGFQEGRDFAVLKNEEPINQTHTTRTGDPIEYHISLDMAKELSMVERTRRGKEARQYFIECESRAHLMDSGYQMSRRSPHDLLPAERATYELAAALDAGKLLGVPLHIVQQEAVKMVEASTGISYRTLLGSAAAQDHIASTDVMLEPTELARRLGLLSAYAANRALEKIGWQIKNIGDEWEPTPVGAPFAGLHAWTRAGKTGYNLKWRLEAVRQAFIDYGIILRRERGA